MVKLNDVCNQYDVPKKLIHQFINAGILDEVKDDIEGNNYGIKAVQRLDFCICLYSLGLDVKTIKEYIFLEVSDSDTRKERIKILQYHRDNNLKHVHKTKKKIDCIDCLLSELSDVRN